MGFGKNNVTTFERTEEFDLNSSNDVRVLKEFEEDGAGKFINKSVMRGKTMIYGLDLYLESQGLVRITKSMNGHCHIGIAIKDADNRINSDQLRDYRMALLKWRGLVRMNHLRNIAKAHEKERNDSLLKDENVLDTKMDIPVELVELAKKKKAIEKKLSVNKK